MVLVPDLLSRYYSNNFNDYLIMLNCFQIFFLFYLILVFLNGISMLHFFEYVKQSTVKHEYKEVVKYLFCR